MNVVTCIRFSCALFASFSPWDLDFYLYLRYFYGTSYDCTLLLTMFSRSRRPSAEYGRTIDERPFLGVLHGRRCGKVVTSNKKRVCLVVSIDLIIAWNLFLGLSRLMHNWY